MAKAKLNKERVIFDNYDLWEQYPDDVLRETLRDNGYEDEDITDKMIENERYFSSECEWDNAKADLKSYFNGKKLMLFGSIGRWNGVVTGWETYDDFMKLFYNATKDCDYIKIYDENGHLYIKCSHHDGTCHYEVKVLTDKGIDYLDRWEYGYDNRKPGVVGKQLVARYTVLPHFAHKVYGCAKREYEPQSKERFQEILNNKAKSFYC